MIRAEALPFLEEMYIKSGLLNDLLYRDQPLLGILSRKEEAPAGGKYVHVPITYARARGRSAVFVTSQTNYSATKRASFDVTYRNNYQTGYVDGDVISDAKGNSVMLTDALSDEMEMISKNLAEDISLELFGNLGGARGRLTATTAINTAVVVITNPEDTINFEKGDVLKSSATDGTSGAVRAGSVTLLSIDREAGTLTATGNWNAGIGAIAVSDFLFADGDFGAKMSGLGDWDPAVAPGATLFFGVDRTLDTKLGGLRYTTGTGSVDQVLLQAIAKGKRFGARFDLCVMNPVKYGDLTQALETQSRRIHRATISGSGDAAAFGYDAIVIDAPGGSVPIIADPSCPVNDCRLLDTDAVKLGWSGDGFCHLINDDGKEMQRSTAADNVEFRMKSRGNMLNYAPGHQMYVAV